MERNQMWKYYDAIMQALERHNIESKYDEHSKHTTFYFHDCCGGDIVDEALSILKWRSYE